MPKRELRMRKMRVSALAALSVLLVLSVACAAPMAPEYEVGVEVGDTATYRVSDERNPVNKSHILVYGVLGARVTFNLTTYNPDGSVALQTPIAFNVKTGFGYMGLLYAGNLATGDPIYSGTTVTVNETIQMMVAGALRSINHFNYYGGGLNVHFDQLTGLVTDFHYHPGFWENWTLLSTTVWAPDTVPSLLNMTTIVLVEGVIIIVLMVVLAVLASRRRRG